MIEKQTGIDAFDAEREDELLLDALDEEDEEEDLEDYPVYSSDGSDSRPTKQSKLSQSELIKKTIEEFAPHFKDYEREIKPFVHLHVHSEFSLLDGAIRLVTPNHKAFPLLGIVADKGMPGVAITDHGNMFGAFYLYNGCKKYTTGEKGFPKRKIKGLVGSEFYIVDDMHSHAFEQQRYHIILIAKNNTGYKNLVQLSSLSYLEGFYVKPRIDLDLLRKHSEGVVCLSACIAGKIPQLLLRNDYEAAKEHAIELRDMFAPGDFYIELQDHGLKEEHEVLGKLVKIAKEIGVKVVATNDAHYTEREDAKMHDLLLCIQTNKSVDDPTRLKFKGDQYYLKTFEEMMETFSWCPEAVTNTVEVFEKCNVTIDKQDLQPPYKPADGSTSPEYLRKLAYKGLEERYGTITDEIRQRAEHELSVIIGKGFADYYLVVWDFINYARTHGIPVGPGRGSGVSSIVAYAIHITNVDPLRYNLLFERFLNPERESPPDFDVDFCYERRGEVIEYVTEKYGHDKVCQILALGTMKAKAAIRRVAKAYNIPFGDVSKINKVIPNNPKSTLRTIFFKSDSEEERKLYSPEAAEIYNTDPRMREVIDMAFKVEGVPINCSKHAAGVVICKETISDYVPLQVNKGDVTTQFQKQEVEDMGMLKMDFLGLKTLTDESKAHQYVLEDYGVDVDFSKLGYDDPEVYKQISSGDTDAVFQLESEGMKKFMKELQPTCLEDVIAGISLYRPGPMDSIPAYIKSKKNPENIVYKSEVLKPILEMTYGCLVYQEQVMQISQLIAGYSLGAADELRRAMGKKDPEGMKKQRDIFMNGAPGKPAEIGSNGIVIHKEKPSIPGAIKLNIVPPEVASAVFDEMANFAKYAFNKSHAAAYAVLAYETAYYKRYYNLELITAVINNRITDAEEVKKYLLQLRDRDVEILPPDINESMVAFKVVGKKLRYGLSGIKNVGADAMRLLVEERERGGKYKSVMDLLTRLGKGVIDKRIMESLIKAGALDCFGHHRSSLMASYEQLMDIANKDAKSREMGQISLFDILADNGGGDMAPEDDIVEMPEYNQRVKLALEKEVLNIYISGHPLDDYKDKLRKEPFTLAPLADYIAKFRKNAAADADSDESAEDSDDAEMLSVEKAFNNRKVSLCGIMQNVTKKKTKKETMMAYADLEDLYSSIQLLFYTRSYDRLRDMLVEDSIVRVSGRLAFDDRDGVKLIVEDLETWDGGDDDAEEEQLDPDQPQKVLCLKVESMQEWERLEGEIGRFFDNNRGRSSVCLQAGRELWKLGDKGVDLSGNLVNQLKAVLGPANVKVIEKKQNN